MTASGKGQAGAGGRTWWYLWRLAAYRPVMWVGSGILVGGWYLLALAPGLVVRAFFDTLAPGAPAGASAWALLALLVGLGLARAVEVIAAVVLEVATHLVVAALLRQNVLQRILHRPGARPLPDGSSAGEAVSRFRNDVQVIVGFLTWILDPVAQVLVTLSALGVLVSINPLITLLVFLPLAAVLVVVNRANARIEKYRRANQEAIGQVTGLLGELFGAVTAVKVAGAEAPVVAHLREINEARRRASLNDVLFTQLLESVSFNVANLGTGILLLIAAQVMQAGRFTVGDFALFVSYLGWMGTVTGMFGSFLAQYRQSGVSLQRLIELLQVKPDEAAGATPGILVQHAPVHLRGAYPPVPYQPKTGSQRLERLEVSGLTYRHPGADQPGAGRGIHGIDLRLERGTLTVVTGQIGSGKTTLLRTLLGLLPRQAGEIRWNGEPVADPASFLVPPRGAYTAQAPRLFSESLKDNILMGLPEDRVDLARAIEAAVLTRDVAALERGLDTPVGPRGVKLSGGQLQRAAAARMLVRDAELLVFDDLSSALDVETEQVLWERILGTTSATCLVVSHRKAVLRRADHIVVLKEGRVEAEGRLDDLLDSCAEMQRLWRGDAV